MKVHDNIFKSIMNNNDIICLSETGADDIGCIPGIKVFQMPRDDMSRNAGVAILVNNYIAESCRVKRMHSQLGIMWLSITRKGYERIFLACCYLPHQYSNRHLTSNYKMRDHFNCLNSDIEEFNALGRVIICGDLNSRTGLTEDRTCIPQIPSDLTDSLNDFNHKVPKRVSCDKVTNSMGKQLIKICKDNCIIILNGRLKGDSHPIYGGRVTFEARGQKGNSLIDYFISSPELAFDHNGIPFKGNSLRVSFPTQLRDITVFH